MKTVNEFLEQYKDYKIKDEEALLKLLEKPRPKTVWDLQDDDEYWWLYGDGTIGRSVWMGSTLDKDRRDIGNCYLTEEDAEFTRERKKVISEMKRLGGTEDMMSLGDEDDVLKFSIICNHKDKNLSIVKYYYIQEGPNIYFETKEQAQIAIDTIGIDRLKKYLFYVED